MRPASFDDHFTQATLFYRSLTPNEQKHIAGAFSFELAKCVSPGIRARMVANLSQIDAGLAEQVAAHLGIAVPDGSPVEPALVSGALSLDRQEPGLVAGRIVAVIVDDATTTRTLAAWRTAADLLGVEVVAVGPHLGKLEKGVTVDRSLHITDSVEYDGVVLACEPDEAIALFVMEAVRHHKTVAVTNPAWFDAIGMDPAAPGVEAEPDPFFEALARHRHWDRT